MEIKVAALGVTIGLASLACEERPAEPDAPKKEPLKAASGKPASARLKALSSALKTRKMRRPPNRGRTAAKPVATVPVAPDDPIKGKFDLAAATKGLTGKGRLVATLDTEKGKLECELWEEKAPITVANFVGLSRGLRPWKNAEGKWVKKPAYDGTTFHRTIKGFMIQGGDHKGDGSGQMGYVIPDEVWEGASHDKRGLLCMANRGPNTNSGQFFIMDGAAAHLDGGYTIFGMCAPGKVIEDIVSMPTRGDRAVNPVKIKKVTVKRDPKRPLPSAAPPASGSATPAASGAKPPKTGAATKPGAAQVGGVAPAKGGH